MSGEFAEKILASRRDLMVGIPKANRADEAAEGGCGVLGFAANLPVAGRHVLAASRQMHNRGNGKGGGIAMAGLDPQQARVSPQVLHSHYLLQLALLDPLAREVVEAEFILPHFDIAQSYALDHIDDYLSIPGLEVQPPDVWRYFVRLKPEILQKFAAEKGLQELPARALEDEFVYRNSFQLNQKFYASLGEKRAFVLSHGKDLSVLKIVGYAEDVVEYYRLGDQTAHVWIAHQRYPTKGRVWHPGGAHPFIGLNEALVHNGDFANYHAVGEYLRQRNIGQLFLTDTEVSVQLFDLWDRVYGYPLEITLEAMAPTTEHDLLMLPLEKRDLYRAVQRAHMHGSPDGPWFFIVARTQTGTGPDEANRYELLGITDTSMLRPQVFALYENDPGKGESPVQIGLVASERQAINACLRSLAGEDPRFQPLADRYWVARGGSHTDGGAFRFTVSTTPDGELRLACANKFGRRVSTPVGQHLDRERIDPDRAGAGLRGEWTRLALHACDDGGAATLFQDLKPRLPDITYNELAWGLAWLKEFARNGQGEWDFARGSLELLHDRRYDGGDKKRASILTLVNENLRSVFDGIPGMDIEPGASPLQVRRLDWPSRHALRSPGPGEALVIDAQDFPPEGEEAAARWMVRAQKMGWRRLFVTSWRGGRFAACGLGEDSTGTRIDLYGDVGDYAGSGLDGAEVHLHGDGQDQVGQILKSGRLAIYGDVGQTFLYGAKGGEIYVLGSAAGRPLINAVGRPRAVINGTCLDYLAESFMAGDPHHGGGFVVLNGVEFDPRGRLCDLETPYPGGNLFSLASGGAIYLRDPYKKVDDDQLNGGAFAEISPADWELIEPTLQVNEKLFGIRIQDLLTVEGKVLPPQAVYRKVEVRASEVLRETYNR